MRPTIERIFMASWTAVGTTKMIVVEAVLLVPQTVTVGQLIHHVDDRDKMLEEFRCHVLVQELIRERCRAW